MLNLPEKSVNLKKTPELLTIQLKASVAHRSCVPALLKWQLLGSRTYVTVCSTQTDLKASLRLDIFTFAK